jgi:hypothetical protein
LRQRVIAACHIGPLDADDTQRYIEHRLKRVGWKDVPLITADAFEAIFAASGGIPRRINLLCDRVLLSGFLTDKRVFSADTVNEVAAEINAETFVPNSLKRRASDLQADPIASVPDSGILDVDFTHHKRDIESENKPYNVIAHPDSASLGGQLQHVETAMHGLQATLSRIETGNQATLALFRRFLDWVQSRERSRGDRT